MIHMLLSQNYFRILSKNSEMRILLSLFIVSMLISCSEKEEVPVDLEEIMPKSQYDSVKRTDSLPEKTVLVPSIMSLNPKSVQLTWDSVSIREDLTFPERFSPVSTEKLTYWIAGKAIEYNRWSFPDSIKTMKTFLNWMNCYGGKCLMIELRGNKNIQRNTLLVLQNDTSIIQIQSSGAGLNELNKWKKLYFSPEEAQWNYIITQPRGGKAIWSKFENKEEIEFIQSETE